MRLFEGQDNKIEIFVASSIDVTGFSLDFVIGDYVEKIDSIVDGGLYEFTMSSADVAALPTNKMYGCIVVVDSDGNPYQTMTFDVRKLIVENTGSLVNAQNVGITISSNTVGLLGNGGSGGGGEGEYVKRVDFNSIMPPNNTINDNNDAIRSILSAAKEGI